MYKFYRTDRVLLTLFISVLSVCFAQASQTFNTHITLRHPVELSAEQQALVRSLPPLKIGTYQHWPPLAMYDQKTDEYEGISIDIFRFIADEIGLPYQLVSYKDLYIDEMLEKFKRHELDVLMPASYVANRDAFSLLSESYYQSFYSIIVRQEDQIKINNPQQLKHYKVGIIKNSAVASYVKTLIPDVRTYGYTEHALYNALRNHDIDIAIYNQSIFAQDRWRLELFDLEDIYTLYEYPRAYGFLFQKNAINQDLATIFNQYIKAIDSGRSIDLHEDDEQRLINKYIAQKNRQQFLWLILIVGALMFIFLYRAHRIRRRLLDDLQKANIQLEHLSRTDVLTGLANRRYFDERLTLAFADYQRSSSALSVMMVDIDFFKSINDHYGHSEGDVYLQKIAAVLMIKMARVNDLAARYGGEEFVCLLPNTHFSGALEVAEKIRQAVIMLNLHNADPQPKPVTVSIGVATLCIAECSPQQLIEQADIQLYNAKHGGRNRVCGIMLDQAALCCNADFIQKNPAQSKVN